MQQLVVFQLLPIIVNMFSIDDYLSTGGLKFPSKDVSVSSSQSILCVVLSLNKILYLWNFVK